jgi:1-pyrroline-5-carboxylate dehydrogenase
MSTGFFEVPYPINEPVKSYAPGSDEKAAIKKRLSEMENQITDIPMHIGGKEIRTNDIVNITPPHNHKKVVGKFHNGTAEHAQMAIDAALDAKSDWENLAWEQRAAIFLKVAELAAGPFRQELNASTMIAQSKNIYQAEIDAACELVDFFRFNVHFMTEVYSQQPESAPGIWNRLEYRPLEGFVFAITPFNFTSICANLPAVAAMMGNTVVWKPADSQIYSAQVIMDLFKAAGLPDGVINIIYGDGPAIGDVVFNHADFAGLHFTGSTGVFQHLWKTIGNNIHKYKAYPRIVGETGGKDFIVAHKSANAKEVATGISRGAFEFHGQKKSSTR